MPGSRLHATACLLVGTLVGSALASASVASAETGMLVFTAETLHSGPLDPLIAFSEGRSVSLVPHFAALASHSAEEKTLVLLLLESGDVTSAQPSLGELVLYDEQNLARTVAKLLDGLGSVLLLETAAGATDPESAMQARSVFSNGDPLVLYREPGVTALPEPGLAAGCVSGAALLYALRRRKSSTAVAHSASGPGQSPSRA